MFQCGSTVRLSFGADDQMWIVAPWSRRATFHVADDDIIVQIYLDTLDSLDRRGAFE